MLLSGIEIPGRAIRELITSSINLVVQVSRYSDGTRRVASISEIIGMEQSTITMQELFRFEREGVDETGRVIGHFRPTGIRPKCMMQLAAAGIYLPPELFDSIENKS